MMKLFYSTDTISMPCVIAKEEAKIDCEMIEVSWKRNLNVDELNKYNPLGKVGTLVLDNGQVLTQNIAILNYFAELKPESKLLPAGGTLERAQALSWMSFLMTDLWPSVGVAFQRDKMTTDTKAQEQIFNFARKNMGDLYNYLEKNLRGKEFIAGSHFTIADCMFAAALPIAEYVGAKFEDHPEIKSYMKRLGERPSVQKARAL